MFEKLKHIIKLAGLEILNIYQSDNYHTDIKHDNSPVTTADVSSQQIIIKRLKQISDYPIISDNTPTIEVNTNKNAICKGSLDVDEAYENMDFIFYGTQKEHDYDKTKFV